MAKYEKFGIFGLNLISAIIIILIDTTALALDLSTFTLFSLAIAPAIFTIILFSQLIFSRDSFLTSILKGFISALAVAIPGPLAGSILGGINIMNLLGEKN